MSLGSSLLNISGQSSILNDSILEESTLNNNVNFSKLELSQITTNNTTIHDTHALSEAPPTPKLSITLDPEEQENLRKHAGKGHKDSSVIDITLQQNGTIPSNNEIGLGNSTTTTITKDSVVTEVLEDEEEDEEDISIIQLEVEDDDSVEEVSTLENAEETQQSIKCDMFSHLQPNKTSTEPEKLQESVIEQEMQESQTDQSHLEEPQTEPSCLEQSQNEESHLEQSQMEQSHLEQSQMEESVMELESSQYLPDETDLFQYPFIEVGRRLWPSDVEKQHYTKGCLWSPDGTCLLVPVHLDGMHVVELPTDLYTMQELNPERNISTLQSAVHVKEGGTVYDCCWYPYMNSTDPATCCWLATRQHEPIQMWDAFSGELRCSYRGYDDVDEVETAISIIFSNDAQKVIGGYKKTIKIFDTNIPGRDCFTIPIKNAVSCFALTTDNDNCVTAGTWTGYINHYDLRAPKLGPLFTLGGHTGGITWLKYSPTQDHNWYLFSGARRDNKIFQWDMRNYTEPVQIFERNVQTNQRIYYDLTPLHKWLGTGDTGGLLRIWNLGDKEQQYELPLHTDCCNGVSFHPTLPILSTSSGQYHFVSVTTDDDDVKKSSNESKEKIIDYENSLLFLWFGRSTQE